MLNAQFLEFPFVAELPKREKSKLGSLWDQFGLLKGLIDEKGAMVPPVLAGKLLDVSYQRVWQLVAAGKLERVEFGGHGFITENSIVELARSERKTGRPLKLPVGLRDTIRFSIETAGEMRSNCSVK
jgi:hypothetical protein